MRTTQFTLTAILALSATATIALAGNNNFKFNQPGRSGNNHSQSGGGNGSGSNSQSTRSQFSHSTTKKLQGMTFSNNNHSSSGQTFQKFNGAIKKFQVAPRTGGNGTTFGNSNVGKSINREVLHQNFGNHGSTIQRHIPGLAGKIKTKPIDPGFGNGGTIPIDPGKGNGKPGNGHHDDHHDDHRGDHHDDHHGHHHHHQSWPWPWVIAQPFPYSAYSYPSYPIRVSRPVVVNRVIQNGSAIQGSPQLVAGIDLQLVDVRLVDAGDPNRNLGPRFRVVVGNRGTRDAGNFQVLAVAAKDEQTSPESPSTMVEVAGIASGQIAKVDVRLPMEAMTVTDGQPFKFLAVVVDVSKLIDEAAEEDNAGLLERGSIKTVDAK